MEKIILSFWVDGKKVALKSDPNRSLLELLREDLGITGVKDACGGEGECGACTVLLDGFPVNSCLVLVGQVNGRKVETIESLSRDEKLHPIQQAFIKASAVQCGYCTPGAIMAVKGLLDVNADPDDDEIREALSGNLCRCTGYTKIIDAVHMAAQEMSHGR